MPFQLRRDAPAGTPLPELRGIYDITVPWIDLAVQWTEIPDNVAADGFRLLVDDVERYTGPWDGKLKSRVLVIGNTVRVHTLFDVFDHPSRHSTIRLPILPRLSYMRSASC